MSYMITGWPIMPSAAWQDYLKKRAAKAVAASNMNRPTRRSPSRPVGEEVGIILFGPMSISDSLIALIRHLLY